MASKKKGLGDLQDLIAGVTNATTAEKIQLQKNVIPKLTTTERNALAGDDLIAGTIIYNTSTNKLNVRVAAGWEAVTSA